jgi:alkylation response protein AidB-like acyl-CoA dehydrogenase
LTAPFLRHVQAIESARETMRRPSFMAGLFAGLPPFQLLAPAQLGEQPGGQPMGAFLSDVDEFLRHHVDPAEIERRGEIDASVLRGLAERGCFGLTIPTEYGGLGLSQVAYNQVLALVARHCNVLALLLSAHQSIGVPRPVLLFGTQEQKQRWLPRIARGALSAFALTEPQVGSDPASMTTTAALSPDGRHYLLNGEKLWCTNGGIADALVLMAKVDGAITAFIVERQTPGIEILQRCTFMGCRGIDNVWLRLNDVAVPVEDVLGEVGQGLRIALTTLNTGRVSLAAICVGMARQLYGPTVRWAGERQTFGRPIGRHELNGHKLAQMAADLFAMEAVSETVASLVDRGEADYRIEAAAAKLFCSERLWSFVDNAFQIRGGRAYETGDSLRTRGETPLPVEQIMRDARLYLIGEGASEILTLFIAREAWDPHLRRARAFFNTRGPAKLYHALRLAAFYLPYYLRLWRAPATTERGILEPELAKLNSYVERTSRRLARALVYAMVRYGPSLERRQALVARLAAIGVGLFVMSVVGQHAARHPRGHSLASHTAQEMRVRIDRLFTELRQNRDETITHLATEVVDGDYSWLSLDIQPALRYASVTVQDPTSDSR